MGVYAQGNKTKLKSAAGGTYNGPFENQDDFAFVDRVCFQVKKENKLYEEDVATVRKSLGNLDMTEFNLFAIILLTVHAVRSTIRGAVLVIIPMGVEQRKCFKGSKSGGRTIITGNMIKHKAVMHGQSLMSRGKLNKSYGVSEQAAFSRTLCALYAHCGPETISLSQCVLVEQWSGLLELSPEQIEIQNQQRFETNSRG